MESTVQAQRIVVTGAAGFIGSHLTEALAGLGHSVLAIDCLLDASYSSDIKRENWNLLSEFANVERLELDLRISEVHEF